MVHLSLIPSLPPLSTAFAAVISTMPATPPPSPPALAVPFSGDEISAASISSSQHFQQAARFQDRLQRLRHSPELRRVPSTSTIPSNNLPPPPPPPPPPVPVTFNGRQYNNLPPHLATALARMSLEPSSGPFPSVILSNNNPPPPSAPPLLPTPQPLRQQNAQLLPVSTMSFFPSIIDLLNIMCRLLPPPPLLFLLVLALALALALILAPSLPLALLLPPLLSRCPF